MTVTDDLVKRLPWRSTKRVPRSTMGYGGGLMLLDGNDACVGYVVTLNKSANINPVEMDDAVCAAVEAAHRQAAYAAGLERAAVIAEEWRDENKESAAEAQRQGNNGFAAELRTAAVECNALATAIRAEKDKP